MRSKRLWARLFAVIVKADAALPSSQAKVIPSHPFNRSAVPPTKEKAVYSRPVFKQRLTVNSLEAQRVTARIFERVQRALLSLDVILRIIGKQEAIDPLAAWISEQMAALDRDFDQEAARLKALMDEHGIQAMPTYTHPAK